MTGIAVIYSDHIGIAARDLHAVGVGITVMDNDRQLQLARQLHLTSENNLLPCARTLVLLPVIIQTDLSDGTNTRLALRERADFIQCLRPSILDILRMQADRSINKWITVCVTDCLA